MVPSALALLVLSGLSPGETTVTGRVTLGGPRPPADRVWVTKGGGCPRTIPDDRLVVADDGSLQDSVVVLVPEDEALAIVTTPEPPSSKVLGRYCELRPRVQIAPPGTRLRLTAEPGSGHRLHAYRDGNSLWRKAPGEEATEVLPLDGVVDVRCDAGHEWEVVWIYLTGARFAAVTGRDGAFTFAGVPGGRYRLRAWHPYLGEVEAPIEVDPASPSGLVVALSGRDAVESMYPESAGVFE